MVDEKEVNKLAERADALGVPLSHESSRRLMAWRDRLLIEGERVNLTAVRDPEEATSRLILDSLAGIRHLDAECAPHARVVDLGTGGGVPGVPIAIARPDLHLTLVESRKRKTEAVQRIVDSLEVQNVQVVRGRLSDLCQDPGLGLKGSQDAVICRAVGSIAAVLAEASRALSPNGDVIIWKTDPLDESEAAEGDRCARNAGFHRMVELHHDAYKPTCLVRYRRRTTSP